MFRGHELGTYCALAAMLLFTLSSLVSFDLNFYMLRNLHSIVSLALFLCCVFCIFIRYVPLIVHYYPFFLFNLLCNLCIFSVNLVIAVPSILVLFEVLLFVTDGGLMTETFQKILFFISFYYPHVVHFWSSLTFLSFVH